MWLSLALAGSWPDLASPAARTGGGEGDAAVIIGVEDYLVLPDIEGARANAAAWYDLLTVTRGLPLDRVRLLRDGEASREEVLAAVQAAASQVAGDGRLWVVFIGHGAPALDGTDGWLVGVDAQLSPKSLAARSVTRSELLAAATGVPVVAVLDACFSGRAPSGDVLIEGLQPVVPGWALPKPIGKAVVLAAGAADQVAGPLPGAQRPAFSYLMVGALRGWGDGNSDGVVTGEEAMAYTRSTLAAVLNGREQVPTADGDLSSATLSTAHEVGPDVQALMRDGFPAEPAPARTSSSDPHEQRLLQIFRLRNSQSGQRELEQAAEAFPGAGYRGIVVGRTTLSDVLELRAINTFSECWLEGRDLPKGAPVRCHDLPEKRRGRATSLVMPAFHAYAPTQGGPIEFLEFPPTDHGSPLANVDPSVQTVDGVHVGMSREQVEVRMGPPSTAGAVELRWEDVGLQLLMDSEDRVRVMRIYAAEGLATP